MKYLKPLLLLACAALALVSCEKSDDGDKAHGQLKFDGKTYPVNGELLEIAIPPATGSPFYREFVIVGITKNKCEWDRIDCIMNLPIGDFDRDMKIMLDDDSNISFVCGGKRYSTKNSFPHFSGREADQPLGGTVKYYNRWFGIDPSTGNELLPDSVESEITLITGGYINWKVKGNTGRLDFRLEMEDGLMATGYANIPMRIFK